MCRTLLFAVSAAAALCVLTGAAPSARADCLLVAFPIAEVRANDRLDPVLAAVSTTCTRSSEDRQPSDGPRPLGWGGWGSRVAVPPPGRTQPEPSSSHPNAPAALTRAGENEPPPAGSHARAPEGGTLPEPVPSSIFHPPR